MSRNAKKGQIQTRSKTLKTLGAKKQSRIKSKVTKNTGDNGEKLLTKVIKNILSNKQSTEDDISRHLAPPKPAINTRNGVCKLAGVARSLYKRKECATKSEVSEASQLLMSIGWTVSELKASKPFHDKEARLGLEQLWREVMIFRHVCEVSFSLLDQQLRNINELSELAQAVTTWADLLKSNHVMNLDWSAAVMDGGQKESDADHLKLYLEAYRGKLGFKIWTYSRLRTFTNHLTGALDGEGVMKRESTPCKLATLGHCLEPADQGSAAGHISDKSTNFSNTPGANSETLDQPDDYQQRLPSESAFFSSVLVGLPVSHATEIVNSCMDEYIELENRRAQRNNDILEKQNVLSRARQRANQARAAFEKGSMLPDLEQYVRALSTGKGAQWSVEAAIDVSESLFNFGRDARDSIHESLGGPLIEEKQAEDDLVACLEDPTELAVEAGVEAKLKELLGLQQWASLEQKE